MRRVTTVLSVAAFVFMAVNLAAQAKPSFAGEWKTVADHQGSPGPDLTITQSATALTLEFKTDARAPTPVRRIYQLDGSTGKSPTPSRGAATEEVSKATWAGNTIVLTTTTGAGDEKRTISIEADKLIVETSAPTRSGGARNVAKVTYQRYQRGYGG